MRTAFVLLVALVALSSVMASEVVDLGERDSASGNFKKFDRVVGHSKPAIVFFYLPGCGHCRGFQPEFREAASHFAGDDVIFARVNADRWDVLSKEYGVERVPDIRFCPAGARGAACTHYPEYSPNTANGVIEFLSGRIGSRFLQSAADTTASVDVAAAKGTCPVIYHDKPEATMAFSQVHAESEVDEEEVESELDEEEADLEAEAEEEMEADEEADEEAEEEGEDTEEAGDEEVSESEEESDESIDEAADEEVDEETDAEEEDAIDEEASEEEAADAHAESEEEMTAFLEIAHNQIDEAMHAFRQENAN